MNTSKRFKTPVVLIIFNRPAETKIMIDNLKKIEPCNLFVISDGPRNENDNKKVNECRKLIEEIDWDVNIKKNYSEINLGCRNRIYSGLNWVFGEVDRAIILEDDCLPEETFFDFCAEMLEVYKDNENVMSIEGTNLSNNTNDLNDDYFFASYPALWGWATWSKSWKKMNLNFEGMNKKSTVFRMVSNMGLIEYINYRRLFYKVQTGKTNSWGYSWIYTVLSNGGLVIVPSKNQIENIGFGESATHTTNQNEFRSNESFKINMDGMWNHNKKIEPNYNYDKEYYKYHNPPGTLLKALVPQYMKSKIKNMIR